MESVERCPVEKNYLPSSLKYETKKKKSPDLGNLLKEKQGILSSPNRETCLRKKNNRETNETSKRSKCDDS